MAKHYPSNETLRNRLSKEVQSSFYPVLIVLAVKEKGSATQQEIKEYIFEHTQGRMDKEDGSLKQLLGRLEKTFGLLQVEKPKGNEVRSYSLTEKGSDLLAESYQQVIDPLMHSLARGSRQ